MQVKTFTGPSTKDIMTRIKAELGPDAIILSTQKKSQNGQTGYEIMAAVDAQPTIDFAGSTSTDPTWMQMRQEWSQLRKQLMAVLTPQMDLSALSPRQQVVLDYLEREGVRQEVLFSLWEKFRHQPDTPTLSILSQMLPLKSWLDTDWSRHIHFFAGPFGSGKSSTVLRLALAMNKSNPTMRTLVVNADRSQGKGRLYLRHYTELSGLSYRELNTTEDWTCLKKDAQEFDLVLIDLPGLSGRQHLDTWLEENSGGNIPQAALHLVLCPGYAGAHLDDLLTRLRTKDAASIIWTKMDEACNYGELLNQASSSGLPVSLLSVGPELKNTLAQPNPSEIWKLLLRHELPQATL